MSLSAFNIEIGRFVNEDIPEEVAFLTRIVATQVLRGVVMKTPVDKGRARGGWMVSIGEANYAVGEGADKDGGAVISAGMTVIAGVRAYVLVIIQNNVEYIDILEGGGSTQAPSGMVAVTVAEVQAAFA